MQRVLELNLPHGARAEVHETGWMTSTLFCTCSKFHRILRSSEGVTSASSAGLIQFPQ